MIWIGVTLMKSCEVWCPCKCGNSTCGCHVGKERENGNRTE